MGEGMISSGQMYCNGELLGEVKELEIEIEDEEDIVDISSDASIKICTSKRVNEQLRRIFGHISQKRCRKLLYSIGYQRNQVNEIIEVMWNLNKSYRIRDVEYWKEYLKKD